MTHPVRLAKTTLVQNDSGVAPVVQIQYLSQTKNAVHAAPYGVHSSPVLNTPCLMITINNDPANTFVFPLSFVDRKNLNELKEGEVALGNFAQNANIFFDENGNVDINTQANLTATVGGTTDIDSTGDATVTAPNVNIVGATNITGNTLVTGTLRSTGALSDATAASGTFTTVTVVDGLVRSGS